MKRIKAARGAGKGCTILFNDLFGPNVLQIAALLILCVVVTALLMDAQSGGIPNLAVHDILQWPVVPPDHRIAYGRDALQFGDLRLPEGTGRHPVAVIIHGGCWLSKYNLDHIGNLCAALTRAGVATWSLEYRRIGNPGGGWPGTFEDIARGSDYLRVLARTYPLDLHRVVVVGHSAGGHLALWLAARSHLPRESAFFSSDPLPLRGVVALAGVTDLRRFRPRCDGAVDKLLGGSPEEVAVRYQQASPIELLPLGVSQRLIHGTRDQIVPIEMARDYEAAAQKKGDPVRLIVLEGAGHFEVIDPQSSVWPVIENEVFSLLK